MSDNILSLISLNEQKDDSRYLYIDPDRIEEKITEKTCAILATHVFGNPCETDRISQIAEKHGLAVI